MHTPSLNNSHIDGNTYENQTGDVACDHYDRMASDVELMKGVTRAWCVGVCVCVRAQICLDTLMLMHTHSNTQTSV